MNINFIAMGKLKEQWYREACEEYLKRLGGYVTPKMLEPQPAALPQKPSPALISAALSREAEEIRQHLKPGSFTVAMCIEGRQLSSEQLAEKLQTAADRGFGTVNFIVGSSHGLDETLKSEADFKLSMSPMTFPHSLARVMLIEQVYRAYSIINNGKYHK